MEISFTNSYGSRIVVIIVLFMVWSQTTVLSVVSLKEIVGNMHDFQVSKMLLISFGQNVASAWICGFLCYLCTTFKVRSMGKSFEVVREEAAREEDSSDTNLYIEIPSIGNINNDSSGENANEDSSRLEMMTMAHILAGVSMNYFILVAGGSIALVLKLAEPLATTLLAYLILSKSTTPPVIFSLVLVITGVWLVCHNTATSIYTSHQGYDLFLYPFVIVPCIAGFPLRNTLAKGAKISGIYLYYETSSMAAWFLLVVSSLVILIDGLSLVKMFQFILDRQFVAMICYYAAYNSISYVLLSLIDVVSHSLLGIMKRFYSILGSIILLHEQSLFHDTSSIVGMILCCCGLTSYGYMKVFPNHLKAFNWKYVLSKANIIHTRIIFLMIFLVVSIVSVNMSTSNPVETSQIPLTSIYSYSWNNQPKEASWDSSEQCEISRNEQAVRAFQEVKIAFVHRHTLSNIGDYMATPAHYFPVFQNTTINTFFDVGWPGYSEQKLILSKLAQFDAIIVGGGGLISCTSSWDATLAAIASSHPLTILWAPGINTVIDTPGWGKAAPNVTSPDSMLIYYKNVELDAKANTSAEMMRVPHYAEKYTLTGLRDNVWGHLDDPTCMFDGFQEISIAPLNHPPIIGIFSHTSIPIPDYAFEGYPAKKIRKITNTGLNQSLDDVVAWLNSVDVLVTSSYHGMWWGTLAGKKVIAWPPLSTLTKVRLFPYRPTFWSGNLSHDISSSQTYPHALTKCRHLNQRFYCKVLDLIASRKKNYTSSD